MREVGHKVGYHDNSVSSYGVGRSLFDVLRTPLTNARPGAFEILNLRKALRVRGGPTTPRGTCDRDVTNSV